MPLACLDAGCDLVANSAYSEVYGVPLSLLGAKPRLVTATSTVSCGLGFFGYGAVGLCAWDCLGQDATAASKAMLLSGAAVMASSSAVLVYTVLTKLDGAVCSWCYLSAALSFAMFGLASTIPRREELTTAWVPGSALAGVVAVSLLTVFNTVDDAAVARDIVIDYSVWSTGGVDAMGRVFVQDPVVTAEASGETIALAKRLREAGVRMFGAFWCDHCYDQKQSFGKGAMEFFPYVECYPDGYRKVRSFVGALARGQLLRGPGRETRIGVRRRRRQGISDVDVRSETDRGRAVYRVPGTRIE